MVTHSISGPESDQCSELIPELRDGADERTTQASRGAFGDVEIRSDIYTSKAKACYETAYDQDCVGIWNNLNDSATG